MHTHGPWTLFDDGFGFRLEEGGESIWDKNMRGEDEVKANAHLIAASPELLAAIKDIVERVSSGQAFNLLDAQKAIAKAEGK